MHPDKVVSATRTILDSLRQSINRDREVREAVLAQLGPRAQPQRAPAS